MAKRLKSPKIAISIMLIVLVVIAMVLSRRTNNEPPPPTPTPTATPLPTPPAMEKALGATEPGSGGLWHMDNGLEIGVVMSEDAFYSSLLNAANATGQNNSSAVTWISLERAVVRYPSNAVGIARCGNITIVVRGETGRVISWMHNLDCGMVTSPNH